MKKHILAIFIVFIALTLTQTIFAQAPPVLFTDASERSLNASQAGYLNAIKNRKATKTYKVVTVPSAKDVKNIPNMTLDLNAGLRVQAQRESIKIRDDDDFVWLGRVAGQVNRVTIAVKPGGIYGTIWADGELYRIESLGGDKHAIVEVDLSQFDKEHPTGFERGALQSYSGSLSQPISTKNNMRQPRGIAAKVQTTSQIDVLVLYTPAVAAAVANISALIDLTEAETNTSYENSEADVEINVVYSTEIEYNETGESYSDHLYWLQNDATVEYIRDEVGADICVLLVDDDELNGLAVNIPAGDASEAFCAVYYDAATGNYSFGHEIGHLLGAKHQFDEEKEQHERHGYIYETSWRTIMVTPEAGLFPRIQFWSNPDVDHPTDGPMGTEDLENNVGYALNEYGPDVSGFLPTGNPSAPNAPSNLTIPNEAQIGQNPELEWDASTTLGVNTYKVYRCENYIGNCASTLQVIATTSETEYTDTEVEITTKANSDDRYRYHVTAVQFGLESADSNYEEVWGGIPFKPFTEDGIAEPPSSFKLHQNYPNPFNPVTEIRFDIPKATHLRLTVYDIAGREVAQLIDGFIKAGRYSATFDASYLPSGIYIYKLEAETFSQSARMILAK